MSLFYPRPSDRFIKYLIIITLGFFLLFSAYLVFKTVQAEFLWKPIKANLELSYLTYDCKYLPGRRNYNNHEKTCSREYNPHIEYSYSVDNVKYNNSHIAYGSISFKNKADADKWIADKKRSSVITIYYNPNNPSESIMVKDYNNLLFLPVLIFVVGFGLYCKRKFKDWF